MKAKVGGVEDDENGDAEEDERVHKVWSRGKGAYYGTDNKDFEVMLPLGVEILNHVH